jgi:hypothetical protein
MLALNCRVEGTQRSQLGSVGAFLVTCELFSLLSPSFSNGRTVNFKWT